MIVGILFLAIPFVLMFVFFGWLYKEEKRREQLRLQRKQEWKREIQNLRDAAKEVRKKDYIGLDYNDSKVYYLVEDIKSNMDAYSFFICFEEIEI